MRVPWLSGTLAKPGTATNVTGSEHRGLPGQVPALSLRGRRALGLLRAGGCERPVGRGRIDIPARAKSRPNGACPRAPNFFL